MFLFGMHIENSGKVKKKRKEEKRRKIAHGIMCSRKIPVKHCELCIHRNRDVSFSFRLVRNNKNKSKTETNCAAQVFFVFFFSSM